MFAIIHLMKKLRQEVEELGEGNVADARKVLEKHDKEQELVKNQEIQELRQARNFRVITYNRLLAGLLLKKLRTIYWPLGWTYQVAPTDIGVVFEVKSSEGRYFRIPFKSTGLEKYDLAAVETCVLRAENTLDRIYGQPRPTH